MLRISGVSDPYLEVWHPSSSVIAVFDKVGEFQLVESEIVQIGHDRSSAYWLLDVTLNDDERIEFEAGDVIGYYHPPDTRYQIWSIQTAGYTVYVNESTTALNTTNLNLYNRSDISNSRQPLIQFTIGKNDV